MTEIAHHAEIETATTRALARLHRTEEIKTNRRRRRIICQQHFIEFIAEVAPWFQIEEIHVVIAHFLERLIRREFDRGMVFMPPRTGKSMMASIFLPAWFLGLNPNRKVLQVSYQTPLAEDFGREVRSLVREDAYSDIFPGVQLTKDSRAVGHWQIETPEDQQTGEYRAAGAQSGIAGKGFHLGTLDDPMSEQERYSKVAKDRIWAWWGGGFYTRRQPEFNVILMMATRWAKDDLPGRLLDQAKKKRGADQWEVLNVPGILDKISARRLNVLIEGVDFLPNGDRVEPFEPNRSFQPRRFPLAELARSKENLTPKEWAAIYCGEPVEDEGHILRRKWWKRWPDPERAPACIYIVQVYDTAFEAQEENDFSARTTWGVFLHSHTGLEKDERYHIILLGLWHDRVQAAELFKIARQAYLDEEPDRVIVEKKASGHQLVQELKKAHTPVTAWKPHKGTASDKAKVPRAHATSNMLELGNIWYMDREWANKVIDECADFPYGPHDDIVDTCTIAWSWLRRQFWVDLPSDVDPEDDDVQQTQHPRRSPIYG